MTKFEDNNDIEKLSKDQLKALLILNSDLIDKYLPDNPDFALAIMGYQKSINNRLSSFEPAKADNSFAKQSILSSSSVTKKESKFLVPVPKGYFDKIGND